MSIDPNEEKEILGLIELVDKKYKRSYWDVVQNPYFGTLLTVLLVMFAVEIYLLSARSLGEQLNIAIPAIALIIAFCAVFETKTSDVPIATNYKRLSKDKIVNENNKPLLKALIKMKTKENKISLRQIYNMNKDMFTKEKLLETLYE